MLFSFQIRITDADYADFNVFHASRSPYAKQLLRGLRLPMVLIWAVCIALNFWNRGVNGESMTYALLVAAFGGVLLWKMDSLVSSVTRWSLRRMKKTGKMPFAPESRIEIHEDRIVEITPEQRTERVWTAVERLCLVDGKVWYLYLNNSAAFILPVEQLRAQTDIGALYRFVESKCPRVDRIMK